MSILDGTGCRSCRIWPPPRSRFYPGRRRQAAGGGALGALVLRRACVRECCNEWDWRGSHVSQRGLLPLMQAGAQNMNHTAEGAKDPGRETHGCPRAAGIVVNVKSRTALDLFANGIAFCYQDHSAGPSFCPWACLSVSPPRGRVADQGRSAHPFFQVPGRYILIEGRSRGSQRLSPEEDGTSWVLGRCFPCLATQRALQAPCHWGTAGKTSAEWSETPTGAPSRETHALATNQQRFSQPLHSTALQISNPG